MCTFRIHILRAPRYVAVNNLSFTISKMYKLRRVVNVPINKKNWSGVRYRHANNSVSYEITAVCVYVAAVAIFASMEEVWDAYYLQL